MEGSIGEPHSDGKPAGGLACGGLACGSFGLSRGSVVDPFEPQTATLVATLLDLGRPSDVAGWGVLGDGHSWPPRSRCSPRCSAAV